MKSITNLECGDIVYFNGSALGVVVEPEYGDAVKNRAFGHVFFRHGPFFYVEDHLSYMPLEKDERYNVIHRITFYVWKNEKCAQGAFRLYLKDDNEAWVVFVSISGNRAKVSVEKLTVGFQSNRPPSLIQVENIFKDFDFIEIV